MYKKILFFFAAICSFEPLMAQTIITASDMPVSGDTLRYSIVNPISSGFSISDSGTSKVWDFSALKPISQAVDTYKTAGSINITYALTMSPTAYGYKVADSFPGLSTVSPVTIKSLYTFFNKKTSPSRFVAEGFAAVIAGLPTPANYSDEDEWYYFPLAYGNNNSSTFALTFSIPSILGIKQSGTRSTRVDGWGTIKTPYFTTPVSCIRVRFVINEVDSINIVGTTIGIPRNTVEYRFLTTGEHFPALWVTTNLLGSTETVSNVRYRDSKRNIGTIIAEQKSSYQVLNIFPNPNNDGHLQIETPNEWHQFEVNIFDIQSRQILSQTNNKTIDI